MGAIALITMCTHVAWCSMMFHVRAIRPVPRHVHDALRLLASSVDASGGLWWLVLRLSGAQGGELWLSLASLKSEDLRSEILRLFRSPES